MQENGKKVKSEKKDDKVYLKPNKRCVKKNQMEGISHPNKIPEKLTKDFAEIDILELSVATFNYSIIMSKQNLSN